MESPARIHITLPQLLSIVAVLFLIAAPVGGQRAAARDSAGIRIVTNASIKNAPRLYRIADTASLDIGGTHDDERQELSTMAIPDIYRGPAGEVVVPDAYQVKFFDTKGVFLRVLGRKGSGPGEFQTPIREICRLGGDSLIAMEGTAPRFSVIAGQAITRTEAFEGRSIFHGCLADGSFVVEQERVKTSPGMNPRARYALVGSNGKVLGSLGALPASDYSTILSREVNIVGFGDHIFVSDGRSFEYREYDRSGRLLRIVRTDDLQERFTTSDADRVIDWRVPKNAPASVLRGIRSAASGIPRPSSWPAFGRMLIDPIGRVWLSDFPRKAGELAAWSVFDPQGRLLGRVYPAEAKVAKTYQRVMLANWGRLEVNFILLDSDGATHVAQYRLILNR